jgi:hypothetical protein
MNYIIQRISQKVLEIQYNVNITKPIVNINKSDDKKDSTTISKKGNELLRKERKLQGVKQQIQQKKYQITDEILDKLAESIAKLLVHN